MITVDSLVFRYPDSDFELQWPKLEIATGSQCAITGPSGCGKTTLLRLLAGIERPQTGQITVNEHVLSELSDKAMRGLRNREFGFVFQDFRLIEYLSIRDNILLPVLLSDAPDISGVEEDLAKFDLGGTARSEFQARRIAAAFLFFGRFQCVGNPNRLGVEHELDLVRQVGPLILVGLVD